MADVKISALTDAGAMAGDEVLPIVQSTATKKAKARDVAKIGYQDIQTVSAATKTLALTDRGSWMRFTVANTLTVPTNASVAFVIGEVLNGIQAGSGQVAISAESGVTINKPSGYNAKTRAQGSAFCLVKVAVNEWDLVGDLEASV